MCVCSSMSDVYVLSFSHPAHSVQKGTDRQKRLSSKKKKKRKGGGGCIVSDGGLEINRYAKPAISF